jgi:hypothetical protein
MQYMFLIYHTPESEPTYGTPEFQAMMAGFNAFTAKVKADGVFRSGDGLQGVNTATSLRVRGGKVETMDGPFAETREHLGGYYLLDVPDLDAALRYAALIPVATYGTIEVRPVMDYGPAAG